MVTFMGFGLVGCNPKDTPNKSGNKGTTGTKDLTAKADTESVTMKPGDKKDVKVTFTYGTDVKEVKLEAKSSDEKVVTATIDPATAKATGDTATVHLTVPEGAEAGKEASVTVTASGTGATAAGTSRITVKTEAKAK